MDKPIDQLLKKDYVGFKGQLTQMLHESASQKVKMYKKKAKKKVAKK